MRKRAQEKVQDSKTHSFIYSFNKSTKLEAMIYAEDLVKMWAGSMSSISVSVSLYEFWLVDLQDLVLLVSFIYWRCWFIFTNSIYLWLLYQNHVFIGVQIYAWVLNSIPLISLSLSLFLSFFLLISWFFYYSIFVVQLDIRILINPEVC